MNRPAEVPATSSLTAEPVAREKAPKPSRKWLWLILRVLATVGILAWVARGQEWALLADAFSSLEWWAWLAALGTYLCAQTLSAVRWRAMAAALGLLPPFLACLRLYFLGMFFNLFLPTSIGGDVVRSMGLGKAAAGRHGTAALSVALERVIGLVALLALGVMGYALAPVALIPFPVVLAVGGGALLAVVIWPFLPWILPRLRHWRPFRHPSQRHETRRPRWFRVRKRVASMAVSLHEDVPHAGERSRLWLWTLLLSFPVQILTVAMVVILGESIGIEASLPFYAVTFAAVTIATLLPTIGGAGVREATLVAIFASSGFLEEQGMALGLLIFSVQASASLFGLISFWTEDKSVPRDAPATAS